MKCNKKLTVEWYKTYSTKMHGWPWNGTRTIPRSWNGNFYSISRDANPPIKRPDFNAVLYNTQWYMISLSPSQSEAPFADERVFQKHMVSLQAFPLFPPPPVFPLFPSPPRLPCLSLWYNHRNACYAGYVNARLSFYYFKILTKNTSKFWLNTTEIYVDKNLFS